MWRMLVTTAIIFLGWSLADDTVAAGRNDGHAHLRLAQNQSQSEAALRRIIGELKSGSVDEAELEPQILAAIRQQLPAVRALLDQLGALQRVEFVGPQNGAEIYRATFANGSTLWAIALSFGGKIAVLSFRPEPPGAAQARDPNGEDVSVAGLSGTLRKPAGVERPPVVLVVAGSGPTDRDGNQPGHAPGELRQIAEGLAERGIASLRYDKRAIGRSPVPAGFREQDLQLDNFVDDAAAWLAWLEQRPELGPKFVAGHSEGGLIAILLAKRVPLAGIVLLATPGRRVGETTREQLRAAGLPPALLDEALTIISALERGESVPNVSAPLLPLLRPSVQPFMRSLLALDPAGELARLRVPVLVVQGGHDLQISDADADALLRARPDATAFRVPEMNHVLKLAPRERAAQQRAYSDPAIPLAPGLVEAMVGFIRTQQSAAQGGK
jgi:uncharacterized protein